MIRVEVLTAAHVLGLTDIDPSCGFLPEWLTAASAEEFEAEGGFAAVDETGAVLGIGGFSPTSLWGAEVWAVLDRRWRRHAKTITALVDAEIATCGYRRIEANVLVDFAGGHAWIRHLGFQVEGTRRAAWVDGRDVVMYSRIQEI